MRNFHTLTASYGTNSIIGCADSGLDVNHCYFRDPFNDVSYSQTKINNHRKIAK